MTHEMRWDKMRWECGKYLSTNVRITFDISQLIFGATKRVLIWKHIIKQWVEAPPPHSLLTTPPSAPYPINIFNNSSPFLPQSPTRFCISIWTWNPHFSQLYYPTNWFNSASIDGRRFSICIQRNQRILAEEWLRAPQHRRPEAKTSSC